MDNTTRNHIGWIITIIGSLLAASVPILFLKQITGSFVPTILPQLESDHLYYLTHVQKVLQGHGSLGNPYILEYRDAAFPGLRLPVYLSAIPGLLGLSIITTYNVSAVLYTLLTAGLLFVLCKKLVENTVLAAAIAVLGTASVQNLILRPAVMQTVYPAFLLFIIALLLVTQKPQETKHYVFLGATTALSFYVYPHLWMQTFTAVGLFFLMMLWQRNTAAIRNSIIMGIGIVLLCLPQIIQTVALFTDPMASLINLRSGLVETHRVLPLTLMNNKYSILVIAVLIVLRIHRKWSRAELVLFLLSASVLIAATSNVVTGKLMDFSTHPWRLGMVVNIVAIAVMMASLKQRLLHTEKLALGFCVLMLTLSALNRIAPRANAYSYVKRYDEIVEQYDYRKEYERIFAVLSAHDIHNSVIAADTTLSFLLPLYTDNTVLFVGRANLHVLPQDELLERFLTQNVSRIDEQFLRTHVNEFAGLTYKEVVIYHNAFATDDEKIEEIDLIGGQERLEEILEQAKDIDEHYEQMLEKFNVHYIIEDSLSDINVRVPRSAKVLYEDERFTIYKM